MAKNVFRSVEVVNLPKKVVIESPFAEAEPVEEVPVMEEYTGPTAEDLRREAEFFKKEWEKEKEAMIASAKAKVDELIKDAERKALEEIEQKTEEARKIKQEAEEEAARIKREARIEAEAMIQKAKDEADEIRKKAEKEGFDKAGRRT